jgi:hypothetical protein
VVTDRESAAHVPSVSIVAGIKQVAAATARTTQLPVLVVVKSVALGVYK